MRFQPSKNWMNDPNGPIFHEGRWHLFYQYNPNGDQWGEIGWGHASSSDLVTWEEQDLALYADGEHFIFSGSVVHDAENVSGLGTGSSSPLIAYYTGHHREGEARQVQCMAYSLDDGATWNKYRANPILDLGEANFRDPKVFWHEPSQKWIMLTVLAAERSVLFHTSINLISWDLTFRFDAPIIGEHEWECPDLLELPVSNSDPGDTKWVLFVSVGGGAPAGGVGVQYFIGDFDGVRFLPDVDDIGAWVDQGPDFYAPQSFAGLKNAEQGGVWLGWMNNWIYAKHTLANPSRGMMTAPRHLTLHREGEAFRLIQIPFLEPEKRRIPTNRPFQLRISSEQGEFAALEIDPTRGRLVLDRTGLSSALPSEMRNRYTVDWEPVSGAASYLICDNKGMEAFLNGGRVSFTALLQFEGAELEFDSSLDKEAVS